MMRAIVADNFGPPEVMRLGTRTRPEPGPNDVLVEIVCAGINPVDAGNRRDGSWAGIEPPFTPGCDASGTVVALGDRVDGFAIGDPVYYFTDPLGTRLGSYAEYQTVDAAFVAPKPTNLTYRDAAAVPLAAGTAYELVRRRLVIDA